MVFVPEVFIAAGEKIQARLVGMFRWAEVTKRKSDIMRQYNREFENVLWRDLRAEDYTSKDPLDLDLGTIDPRIIKDLRTTVAHVLWLARLTRIKHFEVPVETIGWIAYHVEIREALRNRPESVRGVFVRQREDVFQPHYAGIPVWLVCGIDQLPEFAVSAKEVVVKKLDDYLEKKRWKEGFYTGDIAVWCELKFCRTKEERAHQPQGSSSPSAMSKFMHDKALTAENYERKTRHAEYPLTIVPWWSLIMDELTKKWVDMTTPPVGRSQRILPPPIIISKKASGQACLAWLALRQAWLSRMMRKMEGFDREGRQIILRQREREYVPHGLKEGVENPTRRQQEHHESIERVGELLSDMHIEEKWKGEEEPVWKGRVISPSEFDTLFVEDHHIIDEIVYEITELNFRCDILLLDHNQFGRKYEVMPGFVIHRQMELYNIFDYELAVDKDGIRAPAIWFCQGRAPSTIRREIGGLHASLAVVTGGIQ
ncbi:hypothetical protein BD410DRAFT_832083 [Rickenella mellea]|uniref:Uncharacterized protein n=1 Tax=Rickenella mellea TaxID=50990 RepID=A0A4Y7PM24_9AGAM|nr:hypothetical protein BD410DRAFT_832083 [Rickenella mellea]